MERSQYEGNALIPPVQRLRPEKLSHLFTQQVVGFDPTST